MQSNYQVQPIKEANGDYTYKDNQPILKRDDGSSFRVDTFLQYRVILSERIIMKFIISVKCIRIIQIIKTAFALHNEQ